MGKYGFMFPGAGMDYDKYLPLLEAKAGKILKQYCARVYDQLRIDIYPYIHGQTNREEDELLEQLAMYTVNCWVDKVYRRLNILPGIFMGYSMGIYSALTCGEGISFEAGLDLVVTAYETMKLAVGADECAMWCIIGLTKENVEEIIETHGCAQGVEIANENSEYSVVISGRKKQVEEVKDLAAADGALQVVKLKVSIPYHTSFNNQAAQMFMERVEQIKIRDLPTPLLSSINQRLIQTAAEIRDELGKNINHHISWAQTVKKAGKMGFGQFIEVGTGESLSRLSTFIDRNLLFYKCRDLV